MFRRVLDSYPGDRMAVGEAWVPDDERLARYVRPDELNLAFNFRLVQAHWGADTFRDAIDSSLSAMARVGAPCTWVLSNHDVVRHVTRYGGGALGLARGRAAALVQLSLPGAAYVYNGDELGLPNVDLPDSALQDPTWERSGHTERGRDGERVPLPWNGSAPPYGFTTGTSTWLPGLDRAGRRSRDGRPGLDARAVPAGAGAAAQGARAARRRVRLARRARGLPGLPARSGVRARAQRG